MNQILNNNILQWQPVKRTMTYHDFVKTFPRSERIKHCNFNEIKKDEGHIHQTGIQKHNFGQILSNKNQNRYAVLNLKKFILDRYNIELIGPQTGYVHLCHLCEHNSKINDRDLTKHTCTKETHTYFGTASENQYDIDPVVKSIASSAAGLEAAKSPKHSSRVRGTCRYCGLKTTEFSLTGHINACHFNPTSHNYLTPITRSYKKNVYQQQGLGHKLIELKLMIAENYNNQHK